MKVGNAILRYLQFLAHQGLALGDDGDGHDSNFHPLLTLRSRENSLFEAWLEIKTDKYTSPEVHNSIMSIMANKIQRNIVLFYQESPLYAITITFKSLEDISK